MVPKNTEFPHIMIKYKRFHIYEGNVKFKLMIIITIIVNYLFKLLFKPILTQTIPAILRSINLTYEFLSKLFLQSLLQCIIRLISTFHFIRQNVSQRYYSLEQTVSHLFTSCTSMIVQFHSSIVTCYTGGF